MTPAGVLLSHPSSFEHDTGEHPEQPARMTVIERALVAADWCGYERVESPPCATEALRAVHPGRYVDMVRELAESGGGHIDADTVASQGSWDAARHAAGGAVELVRRLLDGEATTGFSVHRPPGHHAEPDRPMGFCLFNNIAVAARWALDARGLDRVMVVDYDVHHGNGTNAVFHSDPRVLFVSIHQSPLYPGTGPLSDIGSGAGAGYCVNLPVPPGSGDAAFGGLLRGVALPLARAFAPQLILISAGFDAHAADPLAECTVSESGFAAMTAGLRGVGDELGAPVAAVLEGGYALQVLGGCVVAAMRALAGDPPGGGRPAVGAPAADQPDHPGAGPSGPSGPSAAGENPLVARARAHLARWWPVLA
ncbi:MAG TPA: histone deacetylase [Solirubrobacteraceae bacterium]|nr:histone deacetylase [Solirubrobacteraceae bacterium]